MARAIDIAYHKLKEKLETNMHHLRSNAIPADTSGDFNEIIYVNQLQCVVITVILFTSKLATIKNLGTQLDPSKHANILGKSESSPIINSEKRVSGTPNYR